MIIIPPIEITDERLVSTNIAENDHSAWLIGTAYTTGAFVIHNHKIWKAARNSTGVEPTESAVLDWVMTAPTNAWAMFDDSYATQTVPESGDIVVTLEPGVPFNSLAFFNTYGKSVIISITDVIAEEPVVVYEKTIALQSTLEASTWWHYFHFEPVEIIESVALNLPSTSRSSITVTVKAFGSDPARCGLLAVGKARTIGETLYGVKTGIIRYSRIVQDDFGRTTIIKRLAANRMSLPIKVPKKQFASIRRYLAERESAPAIYAGSELEEATLIYGLYKDFDMAIESQNHYTISLNVDGFI